MSKLSVLDINGENTKDITLNKEVFNIEPNDAVLYNAIILQQASLRQGTHSTKTRSEVRGGGRKPWKQKGTGNARQGSIRAPHWVGGGVAFGPTPEKNYIKKMNKKERRLAILSALSYKANDKELVVVENLNVGPKTKDMVNVLNNLKLDGKILMVINELKEEIILSSRNLENIRLVLPTELNVLDIVNCDKMLVTLDALKSIEEVLL